MALGRSPGVPIRAVSYGAQHTCRTSPLSRAAGEPAGRAPPAPGEAPKRPAVREVLTAPAAEAVEAEVRRRELPPCAAYSG